MQIEIRYYSASLLSGQGVNCCLDACCPHWFLDLGVISRNIGSVPTSSHIEMTVTHLGQTIKIRRGLPEQACEFLNDPHFPCTTKFTFGCERPNETAYWDALQVLWQNINEQKPRNIHSQNCAHDVVDVLHTLGLDLPLGAGCWNRFFLTPENVRDALLQESQTPRSPMAETTFLLHSGWRAVGRIVVQESEESAELCCVL